MVEKITVKLTKEQIAFAEKYESVSGIKGMKLGKLGELCVISYLRSLSIHLDEDRTPMDKPDYYDIKSSHSLIDVKTAVNPKHKRIYITKSLFDKGRRFEFYIGVQLDIKKGIATIYGYATKKDVQDAPSKKAGDREVYYLELNKLRPLKELVTYLKKSQDPWRESIDYD